MYPIYYAFVVIFNPCLNLDRIFVVRSFNHTFEQLNDDSYLSNEMLKFFDPVTAKQRRDCAKARKIFTNEMFSCELKFTIDICKKWIDKKFTRRYLELDIFTKQRFKRENPIQLGETKCSICNFDLAVGVFTGPHSEKMTYFDFAVKKEHSFIRNVFDSDELSACNEIKTLKNYFESFKLFLQIVLLLHNTYFVESDTEDNSDDCIANFVEENEI